MKHIFNLTLTKNDILLLVALCIFFLVTRITNLTLLPIFTDEAIYLRWAQLMFDDPGLRFVSLSDGKQPLQMWASGLFMEFIPDQLWAGRFPMVICGLLAMLGLWFVAWELFRKKTVAWTAAVIYLIAPPYVLHDRMGMADTMLAMWGIWSLYLNLLLWRTRRFDIAMLLGFTFGLGLFTKSPALFYWLLAPLVMLLISRVNNHNRLIDQVLNLQHDQKNSQQREKLRFADFAFWKWPRALWRDIFSYLGLWLVAVILGNAIASVMRLSELYYMVGRKELEFVVPVDEWLADPFGRLYGNLYGMTIWFRDYLGLPLSLLILGTTVWGIAKRDSRIILLALFGLLPWVASASRAKVLYPRYLLFFMPYFLLIGAYGINKVSQIVDRRWQNKGLSSIVLRSAICVLTFTYPVYSSLMLIFNPPAALLPLQDKGQYIEDTPSGYGVPEIIHILREAYNKDKDLVVGTEGTFGLMPFALQIEFRKELLANDPTKPPDVFIEGYWPFTHVPQRIMELSTERPGYFIVYQYQGEIPQEMPLELVQSWTKPGDRKTIRLYKVKPQRYFSGQQFNLTP